MVLTTDDNDRIIPFSYHILMTNFTRYIPKQVIEVGKPWKYRESQITRTLCVLSVIAMTNIFSSSMDSFKSTFNVMSAPNIISKLSGLMNRIVQF